MTQSRDLTSARRLQSAVDLALSVVIGIMVWPFPVARAMMTPATHIGGVLATCAMMLPLYFLAAMALRRETFGMTLAGLQLKTTEGRSPTTAQSLRWALTGAVMAPLFALVPRVAARLPVGTAACEVTMVLVRG